MEKIIFESQPRHFVTAVLYLPTTTAAPFPAVLMPCGHSPGGKVSEQVHGIFLRGAVSPPVLRPDWPGRTPISFFRPGQARPRQLHHRAHLAGVGAMLVGRKTATYRIWDGIRSLDYLASRPEIDARKSAAPAAPAAARSPPI